MFTPCLLMTLTCDLSWVVSKRSNPAGRFNCFRSKCGLFTVYSQGRLKARLRGQTMTKPTIEIDLETITSDQLDAACRTIEDVELGIRDKRGVEIGKRVPAEGVE